MPMRMRRAGLFQPLDHSLSGLGGLITGKLIGPLTAPMQRWDNVFALGCKISPKVPLGGRAEKFRPARSLRKRFSQTLRFAKDISLNKFFRGVVPTRSREREFLRQRKGLACRSCNRGCYAASLAMSVCSRRKRSHSSRVIRTWRMPGRRCIRPRRMRRRTVVIPRLR